MHVQQTMLICKKCKKTTKEGNTTKLISLPQQKHPLEYEESQKCYKQSSGKSQTVKNNIAPTSETVSKINEV